MSCRYDNLRCHQWRQSWPLVFSDTMAYQDEIWDVWCECEVSLSLQCCEQYRAILDRVITGPDSKLLIFHVKDELTYFGGGKKKSIIFVQWLCRTGWWWGWNVVGGVCMWWAAAKQWHQHATHVRTHARTHTLTLPTVQSTGLWESKCHGVSQFPLVNIWQWDISFYMEAPLRQIKRTPTIPLNLYGCCRCLGAK